MIVKLDDKIKEKLSEAVEMWADKNLIGKPALLANGMYFALENKMIEQIRKIEEHFGEEQK